MCNFSLNGEGARARGEYNFESRGGRVLEGSKGIGGDIRGGYQGDAARVDEQDIICNDLEVAA